MGRHAPDESASTNLVDDTTPQLGGDLDLNGFNIDFPTTPNISDVLDEDTMASDSATALATQQSIKAYVDTQLTAQDLDLSGDTGTIAIDLDGEVLTIATDKDSLSTSAATNTLTITLADVLEDLDTLGPSTADGEFLVATAAGVLAWESGSTARDSIGLGTGDSPQLTDLTLTNDLLLASASIINFNSGDVTLTHSLNTLTMAGGTLVLPASGLQIGSSNPFSDSAGTLTLQNVDALDATTESTIESAIDTLANLTSVQGQTVSLSGAFTVESESIVNQDLTTDASPQFTGIELGHASDTTLTRASAGDVDIEGNIVYRAGGTDVPVADGGTGASSASGARTNLDVYSTTEVDDAIEVSSINAQTDTAHTLVTGDRGQTVTMDNGSANEVTIPANASVAFDVGTVIHVVQIGAGTTTITGDTGVTLNGVSAGSGDIQNQYQGVSLLKVATNAWIASGDIGTVA